ncbi:hypothetical protein SESBI_29145 [Sesbania bispinosa]|nr:hypothetical protein SESBI_29145 [Sesbania bispinosa]
MASNNREGLNVDRNGKRPRRDFDTDESSSSNQIHSTKRPTHFDDQDAQSLSKGERVTIIPDQRNFSVHNEWEGGWRSKDAENNNANKIRK